MIDFLPWGSPDSDMFWYSPLPKIPVTTLFMTCLVSKIPLPKRLAGATRIPQKPRKGKMTLRLLKDSKLLGDPWLSVQVRYF